MIPRLHLVTDDAVLADPAFGDVAESILAGSGTRIALHLRGHRTAGRRIYELAQRMQRVAATTGTPLIINDRVDVAMTVGATGVQLGARSLCVGDARALLGDDACIGRSVHATDEVVAAFADGADFVLRGTVYASASHVGTPAAGVAAVRVCVERAAGPVIAIGGITPARVAEIADAGAHGVAVLGGVWHAADAAFAAGQYLDAVQAAWPIMEVA